MATRLLLPLLTAALLAAGTPAAASAASLSHAPGGTAVTVTKARLGFGRGFGRARPRIGSRPSYRRPPARPYRYRRPHIGRGLVRGILQALGVAYLVHLLFGWGAGGSPLGLLLVLAFAAWLLTRRRRRTPTW